MLLNCILLALSVSIDSLGIGVTYGVKKIRISKLSNIVLFAISFCIVSGSIFLGHYISVLLSPTVSTFIGSSFLILLGLYSIYKAQNYHLPDYDYDHSNNIDKKEAIFLGIGLSIDAASVGVGYGVIGFNDIIFPILVSSFQLIFLNCGNYITKNTINKIEIPENILSIFSGIILILVGLLRILF